MSEVSIDELERAINVLKGRASEQQLLLEEASASPVADAVRILCEPFSIKSTA